MGHVCRFACEYQTVKEAFARQVRAVADLIPLLQKVFLNTSTPDLTVSERKTVGEFLSALSSGSPGRKRASTTNEILRTAGEARALNQKLTLGGIATSVFPDYLQLAGDQRMFRRQMIYRVPSATDSRML